MHLAARQEVIGNYTNTANDRNQQETALIAERALTEKQNAIEAGIRMEDIRSRFQLEATRLYWQASDYLIRKFEADVRAEIAKFGGELDLLKADTSVKQGMAGFDQAYEQMDQAKELARNSAHVQEMISNVETWKQSFISRIEAARVASGYLSSSVNGWLGQTNAVNYESGE
jgi:hypothetical protein